MRPLLFASLQPELAEAKGVSLRLVSVLFLRRLPRSPVAACTQIVGVLLVFTLMVGPAAAAQNVTTRLSTGLVLRRISRWCAGSGCTLAFYARLADELLDHRARGGRLWRQPDCAEVGAGAWGAGRQSRGIVALARCPAVYRTVSMRLRSHEALYSTVSSLQPERAAILRGYRLCRAGR